MNCPKCQSPVSTDWIACPKCGLQLNQPFTGTAFTVVNRPSRMQYFAGIATILITSAIAMGVMIAGSISSIFPDQRFVMPGTHQVELEEAGGYIIYLEYESVVDGKIYSTESASGLVVHLYDSYSIPITLSHPSYDMNYELNDRAGEAIFEFDIDEPGTYSLTADYDEGESGPDVVLAIGGADFLGGFTASFIIGTLGFIIGLIIIIRTAVKRRDIGRRAGVTPVDRFWC